MSNIGSPPPDSLPPSRTLLKSTLIALVVAAVLLVVVVLPAEFGVDPTGVGRVIKLKEMGEIKMQLAREAAAADSVALTAAPTSAIPPVSINTAAVPTERVDTVRVALQPNQGREIKLAMQKDARVAFAWVSEGGPVNYDLHADRKAAPEIKYYGYKKGQNVAADSGQLVASFEGMHGWFWRNRSSAPVTVVLTVRGAHTEWKEIK